MNIATKAYLRSLMVSTIDAICRTPFCRCRHDSPAMPYNVTISQSFKPSATLESKKHNLREAASRINRMTIRPGEIFSFWHIVGNPNDSKRFKAGRTIHCGEVQLDLGGGLCQASGIIHHMAILVGLEIMERHNHSVDLYTDDTRFAPIGTDATVFYGFKDFRFRNSTDMSIRIEMEVGADDLALTLHSEKPLHSRALSTQTEILADGSKEVVITDAATGVIVNKSVYKPCPHE